MSGSLDFSHGGDFSLTAVASDVSFFFFGICISNGGISSLLRNFSRGLEGGAGGTRDCVELGETRSRYR